LLTTGSRRRQILEPAVRASRLARQAQRGHIRQFEALGSPSPSLPPT